MLLTKKKILNQIKLLIFKRYLLIQLIKGKSDIIKKSF